MEHAPRAVAQECVASGLGNVSADPVHRLCHFVGFVPRHIFRQRGGDHSAPGAAAPSRKPLHPLEQIIGNGNRRLHIFFSISRYYRRYDPGVPMRL